MAPNFCSKQPLVTTVLLLFIVVTMMDRRPNAVEARDLSTHGSIEQALKGRHEKWMVEHGRTYKDEAEKSRRFEIFKANVDFIDRSNAAGNKYRLAINKFADLSTDEFTAMYTGFKPVPAGTKKLLGFKYENFTLSEDNQEVDWRKEGAVTGIKNQHSCGTSYLFFPQ